MDKPLFQAEPLPPDYWADSTFENTLPYDSLGHSVLFLTTLITWNGSQAFLFNNPASTYLNRWG